MRCSLKQKQSIKRKCPASDRENIASNVRANHIGEDDLLTLFRHVSALGETNVTAPNEIVFEQACKLGCEGIVSKRLLCVLKTLSVLIGGGNHLTSAHNDRAAMLCP